MEQVNSILNYWFGMIEETAFPSATRMRLWFSNEPSIDDEIRQQFSEDLKKAIAGEYVKWEDNARSALALIIIFDQFSRHIYRGTTLAFAQDHRALDLCLRGIEKQHDHVITLIERAFFYLPLMHSENIEIQATSIRAYKILVDLAFPEAKSIFENFLDYSLHNFDTIKRFGRFPEHNEVLGRITTAEEHKYLTQETQ